MNTPKPTAIAGLFRCTLVQAKAQYARNAAQLGGMAEKAGARKYRGKSGAEWHELAQAAEAQGAFYAKRGGWLVQISLEQASRLHCAVRDAGDPGASQLPPMDLFDERGTRIASVAYNGTVWAANTGERIYTP